MDNTLADLLLLSLLLPPLLLTFAVLVYVDLTLRRQLRMQKQRLREVTHLRRGSKRLYLIDKERN